MANLNSLYPDLKTLKYFVVAAEELNLQRAGKRLFISQPPLSRQIKQLETFLGLQLFERHNKGLRLTSAGKDLLGLVREFMNDYTEFRSKLDQFKKSDFSELKIGVTNAFEADVLEGYERKLQAELDGRVHFVRAESPWLVKELSRGNLDFAFVVLPIETQGLSSVTLPYHEAFIAALPHSWPQADKKQISLADLNGMPLFWFKREENPAFYDYCETIFNHAGFSPVFLQEPPEHETILAQVAKGKAAAIFTSSYAVIQRKNVKYVKLEEGEDLFLQLGVVAAEGRESLIEMVLNLFPTTPEFSKSS